MYAKHISNPHHGNPATESLIECNRAAVVMGITTGSIPYVELQLRTDAGNETIPLNPDYDEVYFMNEAGKTISRFKANENPAWLRIKEEAANSTSQPYPAGSGFPINIDPGFWQGSTGTIPINPGFTTTDAIPSITIEGTAVTGAATFTGTTPAQHAALDIAFNGTAQAVGDKLPDDNSTPLPDTHTITIQPSNGMASPDFTPENPKKGLDKD